MSEESVYYNGYGTKNPKFPVDYYSFENGSPISNQQIDKWVAECVNFLKENKDEKSAAVASGDTLIVASRDDGNIEINVCKKYFSYTLEDNENTDKM